MARIEYAGLTWDAGTFSGDAHTHERVHAVLTSAPTVLVAVPGQYHAIEVGRCSLDDVQAAFIAVAQADGRRDELVLLADGDPHPY
ncbi:Uncharacterised protein [Mycolicibacterium fortuitum]|uniref:Uncharacterized protein n=1 Tax=Mycolicibacterium fortuitum TaxID=1766 RepID=A0A378WFI0_MYCFO|nr:Uncharacterised protein [Mycolicibacterium fortuitum]